MQFSIVRILVSFILGSTVLAFGRAVGLAIILPATYTIWIFLQSSSKEKLDTKIKTYLAFRTVGIFLFAGSLITPCVVVGVLKDSEPVPIPGIFATWFSSVIWFDGVSAIIGSLFRRELPNSKWYFHVILYSSILASFTTPFVLAFWKRIHHSPRIQSAASIFVSISIAGALLIPVLFKLQNLRPGYLFWMVSILVVRLVLPSSFQDSVVTYLFLIGVLMGVLFFDYRPLF